MPILVGIDGSGEDLWPSQSRNERYDDRFANSFVKRICDKPPTLNKKYLRGPVALGGGLWNAITEGQNFILDKRRAGLNEPILLTGYSRGAAGVVALAARLQSQKLEVKAMLLFDCVDRHIGINTEYIPANVRHVLHLIRDLGSGSRPSFDNSGRHPHYSTEYEEYVFHCTHAAMGGMPYPVPPGESSNDFIVEGFPDGRTRVTYHQDKLGADRVWYVAEKFIVKHGF
jgi:hypothetical protein